MAENMQLYRVVQFFHPRSSCMTMHISSDVQRKTLNALCMTISGGRTKQLDIFCHVTGFTSDFLSFIVVDLFGSFTEPFNLFALDHVHPYEHKRPKLLLRCMIFWLYSYSKFLHFPRIYLTII